MAFWRDQNPIELEGGLRVSPAEVIEHLWPQLTPERGERLQGVVQGRSDQVVAVLENIYDRGNVSAVMRSAEAFGFFDFRIIENPDEKFKPANRVTAGTEKWLHITKYRRVENCIQDLKQDGFQVYVTHLNTKSVAIDQIDFSRPTAFVLGNEKDGVSEQALRLADGAFVIPMQGMAQSFNISVAGALCFYHAFLDRQRRLSPEQRSLPLLHQERLLAHYILASVAHPELILSRRLGRELS